MVMHNGTCTFTLYIIGAELNDDHNRCYVCDMSLVFICVMQCMLCITGLPCLKQSLIIFICNLSNNYSLLAKYSGVIDSFLIRVNEYEPK